MTGPHDVGAVPAGESAADGEPAAVVASWQDLRLPGLVDVHTHFIPPNVLVAHLRAPEYGEFLDLMQRHDSVYLDTTMAFTEFFERLMPFPAAPRPRLADAADRILLGRDFPNIPYPCLHQLEALARLNLGVAWLRAVCHDNAARLLGM